MPADRKSLRRPFGMNGPGGPGSVVWCDAQYVCDACGATNRHEFALRSGGRFPEAVIGYPCRGCAGPTYRQTFVAPAP
jgi:hypothetical protein